MTIECGNANHPDGPWHPATPLPGSWQWGRRLQRWLRKIRWGCGCPRLGPEDQRVAVTLFFPSVTQDQAAALYALAAEIDFCGREHVGRWLSLFVDGKGGPRLRPRVAISRNAEAISRWAPLAVKRHRPTDAVRIDEDHVAWKMFRPETRRGSAEVN